LTLPIWRAVVGELDYVVCLRNPLEVRASADGALPPEVSEIDLWLRYSCEALRLTAGRRRTFVFYEEWIEDAGGVVGRLASFLAVPAAADGATAGAAAEWNPALRRRQATDLDLASADGVAIEARALHFLVRTLAYAERAGDERRAVALQAVAAALDENVVVRSARGE
jgi:hypothetical protein